MSVLILMVICSADEGGEILLYSLYILCSLSSIEIEYRYCI